MALRNQSIPQAFKNLTLKNLRSIIVVCRNESFQAELKKPRYFVRYRGHNFYQDSKLFHFRTGSDFIGRRGDDNQTPVGILGRKNHTLRLDTLQFARFEISHEAHILTPPNLREHNAWRYPIRSCDRPNHRRYGIAATCRLWALSDIPALYPPEYPIS